MRFSRRCVVAMLVVLAACGGDGGGDAAGGDGEATAAVDACAVLDGQRAAVAAVPDDLIGLDRAGIDAVLREEEVRLRQLAAAGSGSLNPEMFLAKADLLAEARPEVVERWGDHDGTDLSARAVAHRTFRVVPEALVGEARGSEDSWWDVTSDTDWATFVLASHCRGSAAMPTATPAARPPADRPPVPLLAVDLADGTQLVRVDDDGSTTSVGLAGAGFFSPTLSADGRTVAGASGAIRTVSLDGTPVASYEGSWACGGWLGDGTLVLGVYEGDQMRFEAADRPGVTLPITGTFCPVPGATAGEVLVQQGRVERERAWVAVQRADGSNAREVRLPGCTVTSPAASSATGRTAFATNCDEPLERGIWVGDATGQLTHVLTCVCGAPTFSPDGGWLAFAVVPVEGTGGLDVRLGFARTDGSGAFHLPEGELAFPLWPDLAAASGAS